MRRRVHLAGRELDGEILSIGIAEGNDITGLIEQYQAIRDAGGVVKLGSKEVKLSDLRCDASDCGTFKSDLTFRHVEAKASKKAKSADK